MVTPFQNDSQLYPLFPGPFFQEEKVPKVESAVSLVDGYSTSYETVRRQCVGCIHSLDRCCQFRRKLSIHSELRSSVICFHE